MTEAKKKELLGWICTIIGGIFILAGIIFFILSNKINLQLKKTEASIIGRTDMVMDDGQYHTMLEVTYRVGETMVVANYEHPGFVEEDVTMIDIYYNIKEPEIVVNAAILWEPLLVLVLGILILVPGLFLKGFINKDIFTVQKPADGAGSMAKELYLAKQRVMENIFPMLAGVLFLIFGIIMVTKDWGLWAWLFIIGGCVELLYIGMEFFPALITCFRIYKLQNVKNKSKAFDIQVQDEDIKKVEADKKDLPEEVKPEEEPLEPFEIKDIKTKGKSKKKKK